VRDYPHVPTTQEILEKVAEGAAGLVPVVGGPLALVVQSALQVGHARRTAEWFRDLTETVTRLEERTGRSVADLAGDDVFMDAVIAATRAAQGTHDREKLAALRAGVEHCLGPQAPSIDEQARFFRLVDQFTPAHLRLLALLDDPAGFYARSGIQREVRGVATRMRLIEDAGQEFRDRRDWVELLATDLRQASLVRDINFMTAMTGNGVWPSTATDLGRRFLAFVTSPAPAPGSTSGA